MQQQQQQRKQAVRQTATHTCLIVEDSEFDSLRMTRVLNRSLGPVDVKVAATLEHAREMLQTNQIGLILLDNNLPDGLGVHYRNI